MDKYLWIIEETIEAWLARETYTVLPGTVFVSEQATVRMGRRSAFLRYDNNVLTINNKVIDVGDHLPQFLGIIDDVRATLGVGFLTIFSES